jgi:hypothetical protein
VAADGNSEGISEGNLSEPDESNRMPTAMTSPPGALVISLDFELHWGMRDHVDRQSPTYGELAPSRQTVAELAELFAGRGIRATWATVGLLFGSTAAEVEGCLPERRPSYRRPELDPYVEPIGADEEGDPEHLAGSLVRLLAGTPGQEVASHTFSHFYCLEEGQGDQDLAADLAAAQAIAGIHGLRLTSLVLPRNQWDPRYAPTVLAAGFTCIRGPQPGWAHTSRPQGGQSRLRRAVRLADTYGGVHPPPTLAWGAVRGRDGLCDVPASAFLRPYAPGRKRLQPLQRQRLVAGMRDAARRGRIFHLWWHPHNFTRYPTESFAFLGELLDEFDRLSASDGMVSLTMGDVASAVVAGTPADALPPR